MASLDSRIIPSAFLLFRPLSRYPPIRTPTLGLLSLACAATLAGQGGATRLTLIPQIGVLGQTVPFRQDFTQLVPGWVSGYRLNRGLVVGAAVELGRADMPLAIRFEVNRTAKLTLKKDPGSPGTQVVPPASGTVTTGTLSLVFEPRRTCFGAVCPRLLLGGGIKRYGFDANVLIDDIIVPFADDQFRATAQAGFGVRAELSRVEVRADIIDFSNGFRHGNSTYPGKRTHDTLVLLGLGVRLPH